MTRRPWIGVALFAACVSAAACSGGGGDTGSGGSGGSSGPSGPGGSGGTGATGGTGGMADPCGNGKVDNGEACDGADLGGKTCASQGFGSGTLSCKADCTLDTSKCDACGNDMIDGSEECDGSDLGGQDCVAKGFGSGTLSCKADCTFDTSACDACGNAMIDGAENCDGANLNGKDCVALGFGKGTLACAADCTFDTSACDTCGNGFVDGVEECDGLDVNGASCQTIGFQTGTLACNSDCTLNTSMCADENCSDGIDNTSDGVADCADPLCAAYCADACSMPVALMDPSVVNGDTTGHANIYHDNCYTGAGSGPEVMYVITAAQTGVLDMTLMSAADLAVSVRTTCADDATDIACKDDTYPPGTTEHLVIPITAGQTVNVMVEGYNAQAFGPYTLDVKSRPIVCGDSIVDPGEGCDDGNTDNGDGCSSACVPEACAGAVALTPFSTKNADTTAKPDAVHASCAGTSGPEDIYAFTPPADGTVELSLTTANGVDLGVSLRSSCSDASSEIACADSVVNGTELLSKTVTKNTTYAVIIDGYDQANQGPYTLVTELYTEVEPNNTFATANTYSSPWWGKIGAAGDFDFVKVTANAGQTISAQVTDTGDGACLALTLDSDLAILGTDGVTQLAFNDDINGATNFCSSTSKTVAAAGTYYIRVRSSQQYDPSGTFKYKLLVTVQ